MVITGVTKKLAMNDQLISGLESFGVLAKLQKNQEIMEPLFTLDGAANSLVTADLLLDHMTIEWSPESSNKKAQEIDVHKYFCDYIQEAEIRTGLSSQCIQLFTKTPQSLCSFGNVPLPCISFRTSIDTLILVLISHINQKNLTISLVNSLTGNVPQCVPLIFFLLA